MDALSFIIGVVFALILATAVAFAVDLFKPFKKENIPTNIGTLYIHTSDEKDTYSFAFDCELEDIKSMNSVVLKIKLKEAIPAKDLIHKLEQDTYGDIITDV